LDVRENEKKRKLMQIERCIPQMVLSRYDFSTSVLGNQVATVKAILLNQFNAETLDHFASTGAFINPLQIYLDIPARLAQLRQSHPEWFLTPSPESVTSTEPSTQSPVQSSNQSPVQSPVQSPNRVSIQSVTQPSEAPSIRSIDLPTNPPGADVRFSTDVQGKLLALLASGSTSNKLEKADKTEKPDRSITQALKNPMILRQFAEFIQKNYEPSAEPKVKFMDLLKDFHESTGIYLGDKWNARYEDLCKALGVRVTKVAGTGYYKGGTYYAHLKIKLPTIGLIPVLPAIQST
jgi:hypothetical protein